MSRHVEALLTDEEAGLLDFLKDRWKRDEQATIRAAIAAAAAIVSKRIMEESEPAVSKPYTGEKL
jgi:hypothetical protein